MHLEFTNNGKIIGYGDDNTRNFLNKIGKEEIIPNANIKEIKLHPDIACFIVTNDKEGHICPFCKQKRNNFFEIPKEVASKLMMCDICLNAIHVTMLLGMM